MNSRIHSIRGRFGPGSSAGFSLIELLAVIAIISILLTIGAIGLDGLTRGKGVGSAVTNAEALFTEARSLAIGKSTRARVLISVDDPADRDNYLKRMLVVYEEVDPQTGAAKPNSWILSSRGLVLPDQVYFSQDFSKNAENSGGLKDMTLAAGNNIKESYAGRYLYYEFNAQGLSSNPGDSFVVGSGVRTGSNAPMTVASSKRDFGGFVIWKNGSTSLYRSPEQIGISDTVKNF